MFKKQGNIDSPVYVSLRVTRARLVEIMLSNNSEDPFGTSLHAFEKSN